MTEGQRVACDCGAFIDAAGRAHLDILRCPSCQRTVPVTHARIAAAAAAEKVAARSVAPDEEYAAELRSGPGRAWKALQAFRLFVGCAALLGMCVVMPAFMVRSCREKARLAALTDRWNPEARRLASIAALATAAGPERLAGKVLAIDRATGLCDPFTFTALPEDLVPRSPEEVGTVVLIERGQRLEGHYVRSTDYSRETAGRRRAFTHTAEVTLVGLSPPRVLGRLSLEGSRPPEASSSRRAGDEYGDPIDPQLAAWLSKLPRQ